MAEFISSESMQEIFTSASGDGNDALIVQLGVAGMTDLLQLYLQIIRLLRRTLAPSSSRYHWTQLVLSLTPNSNLS